MKILDYVYNGYNELNLVSLWVKQKYDFTLSKAENELSKKGSCSKGTKKTNTNIGDKIYLVLPSLIYFLPVDILIWSIH